MERRDFAKTMGLGLAGLTVNGSRAELEAAGAHAVIQRVEDLAPRVESLCAV